MLFRKIVALVFLATLAGCSDSPPTQPSDDVAIGRYVLKIISGRTLPYTRPGGEVVTDGTLFLSGDGTYSSAVHQTVTVNGSPVVQVIGLPEGSWSRISTRVIRLTPIKGDELAVEATLTLPSLNFRYTNADWGYVKQ
jgi:hypothetical protein